MKNIVSSTSLLLAAIFLTVCCSWGAPESKKSFDLDLREAIEKVAARHGISHEEALKRARELLVGSQRWPVKGGLAVIRDSMYVIASEKTNQVIADGRTVAGAEFTSPEIFVFAGTKLAGSVRLPKGSDKDVVVALFTPEKIKFFDWRDLSGGFYPRTRK